MYTKNKETRVYSWYEVHQVSDNGKVEWNGYLDPSGYSEYYKNELRYNFEDAQAHAKEAEQRNGKKWVVVHCTKNEVVL